MKTRLTEALGIKYPIMCGGMLWVSTPKLCAAISEAGGLGDLTSAMYDSGEELRAAIKETRKLTDKPFCVNVTLLPSFRVTDAMYDEYFAVCCEEKVAAMEIGGKYAEKYMDKLHEAGVFVMHKVGALRHAKVAEKLGYDAVIAAGFEAGGHPLNDDVSTMSLTPLITQAVNIPVFSTGGIVDGRSLAAALALGSDGVMMASRFMASKEAEIHDNIKNMVVERNENETTMICKTVGMQGRGLKNSNVKKILELESKGASIEEIGPLLAGTRLKECLQSGDLEEAVYFVGQSIGRIKEIKSCKDIMDTMVLEAQAILEEKVKLFA
ncbi:nitronate monooxygenase [Lachnospiraceae bacterium ZAX-1]